jgi:hypothetical protein
LKIRHSLENIPDPAQSGTGTTESEAQGVDSNDGIGLCCGVTLGVTDALRRVCLDNDLSAAAQAALNAAAGWT